MSRVHLQCCEAQPIPAVSPKICTMKLQELHNTERPTKWSGHGKMIDPRRNSTYKRPFTWEGNYLVRSFICNMKRPSVKQSMKWARWAQIFGFTWVNLMMNPPVSHFHDNYRLHFSDFQLYQVTLPIDPPISYCSNSCTLSLLRNIQRPIVKQISFTATCSGMPYIYTDTKDRYKEKSVLPG